MSVLRLYKDALLEQMISLEGNFSNPDEEDSLDGGAGQVAEAPLWLAVEQTTLAAAVEDAETTQLSLAAPRFAGTAYNALLVGSEKMLISAGHGSTALTVVRGHNGTTAAAHASGAPVRLAYDCSQISLSCLDTQGPDESGWVRYCRDSGGAPDGAWSAPLGPLSLVCGQKLKLWRRVSVPAGTAAAIKQDLVHRISATLSETPAQ
ncbi:hypothetical protein LLH00_00640 [bacterium]|nr:hypothetical protein [bacterium]